MEESSRSPELRDAIMRGAVVEFVLIAIGVGLYVGTGQIVWPIAGAVLGGLVMVLFLAQAGAFKSRDG